MPIIDVYINTVERRFSYMLGMHVPDHFPNEVLYYKGRVKIAPSTRLGKRVIHIDVIENNDPTYYNVVRQLLGDAIYDQLVEFVDRKIRLRRTNISDLTITDQQQADIEETILSELSTL